MTNPLAAIEAIVRQRHDTGAYGDCHLRVHPAVRELMRSYPQPQTPPHPWAPGSGLAFLTGVPIVVDDGMPVGGWRLVRVYRDPVPPFRRHEAIVREGTWPTGWITTVKLGAPAWEGWLFAGVLVAVVAGSVAYAWAVLA